jgi:hypothetical protein
MGGTVTMFSSGGVVSKIKKLHFKENYKEDRKNKEKKVTKSEKKISPEHKSYTVDCTQCVGRIATGIATGMATFV